MNELREKIANFIKNNEDFTIPKVADGLNISQKDVLLNLPNEVATVANGDEFDKIIKELESWGEVLIIKVTPSFVLEIKSKIPKGSYSRGYYNFAHNAPLSGHLKTDDIKHIVFLSAKVVMGMLSHSILFLDKNGEHIFKVYVARDKKRQFIPEQLEAYKRLKKSFEA